MAMSSNFVCAALRSWGSGSGWFMSLMPPASQGAREFSMHRSGYHIRRCHIKKLVSDLPLAWLLTSTAYENILRMV